MDSPVGLSFVLSMLISYGVMFAWAFIEPEFMFYLYDDLDLPQIFGSPAICVNQMSRNLIPPSKG